MLSRPRMTLSCVASFILFPIGLLPNVYTVHPKPILHIAI
jgi:hypothetical protein